MAAGRADGDRWAGGTCGSTCSCLHVSLPSDGSAPPRAPQRRAAPAVALAACACVPARRSAASCRASGDVDRRGCFCSAARGDHPLRCHRGGRWGAGALRVLPCRASHGAAASAAACSTSSTCQSSLSSCTGGGGCANICQSSLRSCCCDSGTCGAGTAGLRCCGGGGGGGGSRTLRLLLPVLPQGADGSLRCWCWGPWCRVAPCEQAVGAGAEVASAAVGPGSKRRENEARASASRRGRSRACCCCCCAAIGETEGGLVNPCRALECPAADVAADSRIRFSKPANEREVSGHVATPPHVTCKHASLHVVLGHLPTVVYCGTGPPCPQTC